MLSTHGELPTVTFRTFDTLTSTASELPSIAKGATAIYERQGPLIKWSLLREESRAC